MKQELNKPSVICFGEVLWDILPMGKKPGGAPMNVAYHLHQLGINSAIISRVGNDQSGEELLRFLHSIGLSTDLCQIDQEHATSEVHAKISDNHEVSYDILFPVAWDYISWKKSFESLLAETDAFVFGSLAARNETSRATLFQLLSTANYRVFDINLREPHYSPQVIRELLQKSDMVKLNSHELMLVSEWYNPSAVSEHDRIKGIQDLFQIKEILVTKGSHGASYYTSSIRYDYAAYGVDVTDTVGSGDSFLAAFLSKKLKGEPLETTLNYASALGAFITTHSGACPEYDQSDLERFIWKRTWKLV
jgi:fructokinase